MKLKKYLNENIRIRLHFQQTGYDGSKLSDGETYKNKKDAADALNAYRGKYAVYDDNVKELYYFDDGGNVFPIVSNGKVVKGKKIKPNDIWAEGD